MSLLSSVPMYYTVMGKGESAYGDRAHFGEGTLTERNAIIVEFSRLTPPRFPRGTGNGPSIVILQCVKTGEEQQ